jgi:hypothetical protein
MLMIRPLDAGLDYDEKLRGSFFHAMVAQEIVVIEARDEAA